jgi:hypothetical protein
MVQTHHSMSYGIYHPSRGFYVKHAMNPVTGKIVPSFTWKRARTKALTFDSPGAAQRFLEEKLTMPDHGMQRCQVASLK